MKKDYLYTANNCSIKPVGSGFLRLCCNNCGRRLEMYYSRWCPVCEPPKKSKKNGKVCWNLIQIKKYLEIVEPKFNERSFWLALYSSCKFRNDSFFEYFPGSILHWDELKSFDALLLKHFKINKPFTFWVSW